MTASLPRPIIGFLSATALLATSASAPPGGQTAATGLQEQVEVRLIQVTVSVTDPKSDSHRSVPGLTLDQFEIRVDGRALTPDERTKIYFDPICEEVGGAPRKGPAGEPVQRPLIAVLDFNYLDAAGRRKAADALDWLADSARDQRLTVKVYGLTRQVRPLTDGFTNSRDAIRRAAQIVRETSYARGLLKPFTEGVPAQAVFAKKLGLAQGADGRIAPASGSGGLPDIRVGPFEDSPFQSLDPLTEGVPVEADLISGASGSGWTQMSDSWGDSMSFYDPGASLAGIEGILRAHTHLVGRGSPCCSPPKRFDSPARTATTWRPRGSRNWPTRASRSGPWTPKGWVASDRAHPN